jgi:hypothetical protein
MHKNLAGIDPYSENAALYVHKAKMKPVFPLRERALESFQEKGSTQREKKGTKGLSQRKASGSMS